MVRKSLYVVVLAFACTVASVFRSGVALQEWNETWTVDYDGSADFTRIQDAVDAASSGDIIWVYDGIYNESVVIAKSISLLGVQKETTIIDGTGVGTVVQIEASGVTVADFTIRNAGKTWGQPPGTGAPDSCVLVRSANKVEVRDSVITDAAVGIWIAYSTFVDVKDNTVQGAVYGGIIGYASSQLSISRNYVNYCGLIGIHLDGTCNDCAIVENTVLNNSEGLELDMYSARNQIQGNVFRQNEASIVLNKCGGLNVFRRNIMDGSVYNIVVVGYDLTSFIQDIDSSNLVGSKTVYYLTNLHDEVISPENYPNLGYLALVNSTNVTVRDLSLVGNGDGIFLAYSSDCKLANLTISGNRGDLIWGGLTLYTSFSNALTESRVSDNAYGLCFYRSNGNFFSGNSFVDNGRHVFSDFLSPFSNESSGYYSVNTWDDGVNGNYWSDYRGTDRNGDGIGDAQYIVDVSNIDYHPRIFLQTKLDLTPPTIIIVSPSELNSSGYVIHSSSMTIVWNGWDDVSGVARYEIQLDDGMWMDLGLNRTFEIVDLNDGLHTIDIRAFDRAGNVRQERFEFVVDAGGLQLPSFIAVIVIEVVIIVAAVVTLYLARQKGFIKRRETSRKLVR